MTDFRAALKEKKRIVIKIGSSSLTHPETGDLNLRKIEQLVRVLSDLRGQGREVILVSSGAIAAGRQALGFNERPRLLEEKQALYEQYKTLRQDMIAYQTAKQNVDRILGTGLPEPEQTQKDAQTR